MVSGFILSCACADAWSRNNPASPANANANPVLIVRIIRISYALSSGKASRSSSHTSHTSPPPAESYSPADKKLGIDLLARRTVTFRRTASFYRRFCDLEQLWCFSRGMICLGISLFGSDVLMGTAIPGLRFSVAKNPSNKFFSNHGISSAAITALSKVSLKRQWKWPRSMILNPHQRHRHLLPFPSRLRPKRKRPVPANASPCVCPW